MKKRLYAPGPVEVSLDHYKETLDLSMNHRISEFSNLLKEMVELLQYSFDSSGKVYMNTSSGSGSMECAVVNIFSPGEKVIVVNTGAFGERFGEIARVHRLEYVEIKPESGNGVNIKDIEDIIKNDDKISGILVQLVDTSTGVINDIEAIGKLTRDKDIMLIVDAVSGLIANPYSHDKFGADATITASQKGFEIPAGISFITLSDRCHDKIKNRKDIIGSFYFNLVRISQFMDRELPQTPFTPATNLIKPMVSKLREIKENGLEFYFERHRKIAQSVRAGIDALGLEIFTERKSLCNTLTPVLIPDNISAKEVITSMREEYGYIIAGGQKELAGKIIRIGHIGNIDIFDTIGMFSALELSLKKAGMNIKLGNGISAILEKYDELI